MTEVHGRTEGVGGHSRVASAAVILVGVMITGLAFWYSYVNPRAWFLVAAGLALIGWHAWRLAHMPKPEKAPPLEPSRA